MLRVPVVPRRTVRGVPERVPAKGPSINGGNMTPTILHVEDNADIARLVQLALTGFGFRGEVRLAGSVAEALEEIRRLKAEGGLRLVLLDMNLPDGRGLDVIRRIRGDSVLGRVPVVVLSGEMQDETVSEAYSLGANCYIPKSFVLSAQLTEAVESIYRCWAEGAVLPKPPEDDPGRAVLQRAILLNARGSSFYTGLARRFSADERLVSLWLDLALERSNRANFLAFYDGMLREEDHEPALLARFAENLDRIEDCVTQVDGEARRTPNPSVGQALDWALRLESCPSEEYMREGFRVLSEIHPGVAARIWKCGAEQADTFVRACRELGADRELRERAESFRQRVSALRLRRPGTQTSPA